VATLLVSCGDPFDKPAKPEQIKKVKDVLEIYPVLKSDYSAAESDGVGTKGELMKILKKAMVLKEQRGE